MSSSSSSISSSSNSSRSSNSSESLTHSRTKFYLSQKSFYNASKDDQKKDKVQQSQIIARQ